MSAGTLEMIRRHPPIRVAAWTLIAATACVQTAFPLTGGGNLALTVASVLLLSAAMLVDVASVYGLRGAALLFVVAGGGGLIAETVGVHTGFPFGEYSYTGNLGLELLGVPVLVPLAWIMMAWPALVVARRLVGTGWRAPVVGAFALTAWDVFLDPQMVDAGYWVWRYPTPAIPGVDGIPITNFLGWLLVAFLMLTVLNVVLTRPSENATFVIPISVYLWTYVTSVVANVFFWGHPPVALVGGIIMGLIAVPLAISLIREQRTPEQRADDATSHR